MNVLPIKDSLKSFETNFNLNTKFNQKSIKPVLTSIMLSPV